MIDYKWVNRKFYELYGGRPRLFRAPGRVNLIGEHTDYNGGHVLPMAIRKETVVAAAPRTDRLIRAFTCNYEESASFDLDSQRPEKGGFWLNYVEGVARILEIYGFKLKGADLLICSNIPNGAGLSSSAALEIAVGLALSEISGHLVDGKTLALIGQQTEHDFLGANVGIMDQFVSANAVANHAVLLDCSNLEFEQVPFQTENIAIVICDTNIKHQIASCAYNERREECETALQLLKNIFPDLCFLCDVTSKQFDSVLSQIPSKLGQRVRHILTENERTIDAAKALQNDDFHTFGRLMNVSHESMRDDFEISCRELDIMVQIASTSEHVLGARMTGGGFGGSTVNLVQRNSVGRFKELIMDSYQKATNIKPTVFITDAGNGANEILSAAFASETSFS